MIKIEKVKKLKNTFKIIDRLLLTRDYEIISKDFDDKSKIQLKKNSKGFSFSLRHSETLFRYDRFDFEDIILKRDNFNFKVNKLYGTKRIFGEVRGFLGSFNSINFDKSRQQFHRLIIPLKIKPNFIYTLESAGLDYEYKNKTSTRLAIQVSLNENMFHLYKVSKILNDDTKPSYIVIDTYGQMSFDTFSEICHSILIGFGFISGAFIQGEGFFFQYKDSKLNIPCSFYHNQFRDSVKASYIPINSNPHGIMLKRQIADKYQGKIGVLKEEQFSKLCQLIHNEDYLKTALFLISEAKNTSLVSSPGLFSIALETLTNLLYVKNKKISPPIADKAVARKLRSDLKTTFENYSMKLNESSKAIIKNRFDNLNQRTNREKLILPFKALGIKLNTLDIQAIEQRNSFLHGNIPMVRDIKPQNIHEEDKFRYYLHLKLFTLLSSLILKMCGYKGYIVNYPKIYEKLTGVKSRERYYRKI